MKEDNDYSITKHLFIHLITFYFHSVRSVLASFSLPCSWQGKVNVHQSVVKNEIITMNKYCFHKQRYSLYIEVFSLAREAIEAAIVHVFKT